MAHPHPFGEAVAALLVSTVPVLGVVGLLLGERFEQARRTGKPARRLEAHAPLRGLARLDPVAGTD